MGSYIIGTIGFLTVIGVMAVLRSNYGVPELVEMVIDISVGMKIFTWAKKGNK